MIVFWCAWLLGSPGAALPVELKTGTVAAFEQYVQAAEAKNQDRVRQAKSFLRIDESPERARRVREGEILVEPARGNGQIPVPAGLIHDWFGAIFIPGATLAQTFAVIHDYDDYKKIYKPGVIESRLISHNGNNYRFRLRLRRKELLEVVIDSEYDAWFIAVDQHRWYTRTRSIYIHEVKNAGEPGEECLPPGRDHGFLWRVYAQSRFVERDGGVYVELEAIALTRNIPFLLRWFVQPVIRRVSRESLTSALRSTREAVLGEMREVRIAGTGRVGYASSRSAGSAGGAPRR